MSGLSLPKCVLRFMEIPTYVITIVHGFGVFLSRSSFSPLRWKLKEIPKFLCLQHYLSRILPVWDFAFIVMSTVCIALQLLFFTQQYVFEICRSMLRPRDLGQAP